MIQADSTAYTASSVVAGSTSILMVTFFKDSMNLAMPFIVPAFVLIVADLIFGCKAAKRRGEVVRVSKALRRTIDKIVSYACWVVLAATLAVAFDFDSLNKIILSLVMGIEMISVVSNYLGAKGKKVSGLWETLLKAFGKKIDADLSDVKIEDDETLKTE